MCKEYLRSIFQYYLVWMSYVPNTVFFVKDLKELNIELDIGKGVKRDYFR